MAAVHHPKPDTLPLSGIDPEYRRLMRRIAAEQGLSFYEYASRKLLEGTRADIAAREMAQELPEPVEPLATEN